MKRVEWLSPERIIPDVGVANTGDIIGMPDDLADKFINQGEAKAIGNTPTAHNPTPTKKSKTEETL